MKKFVSLVFFISLHACNVDHSKKVDPATLDFETSDSSELFFKNVRQSSYEVEENPEVGLFLYRFRRWDATFPFMPVIVFNWRQDRAYMMIQWNDHWNQDSPLSLQVTHPDGTEAPLVYQSGDMREQLLFLTGVYNAIVSSSSVYMETEMQQQPFFQSDAQWESFRVIMFDYFRLTGVF